MRGGLKGKRNQSISWELYYGDHGCEEGQGEETWGAKGGEGAKVGK